MKILLQIPFVLFLACLLFACAGKNRQAPTDTLYWKSLKTRFAVRNLQSFIVDSQLENSYRNFHRIQHHTIDSVIGYGTAYLYSWQEESRGFTEFTIYVDKGKQEHGSHITYLIFDDRDSLLSATDLASIVGEGGVSYETSSRFIARDSLLKITSATTKCDLTKPAPPPELSKPKGDSTFHYLTVLKDGRILEKQFGQKKDLNVNQILSR